ncbi:uncharacterized protein LOC111327087 isoform X2 [Stylophora pistillata]|uniref:uncharacterized protein LOC111327087 isoform X2 n=1 Tax=Stylophora pistillata TaxID=50429 RepID=UPI000C0492A2|nr:uncharacterized protein LOC111327087 isoform X2 [Stylophora pistillata]
MYQENLQYGTKRKVERRPEKPLLSMVFDWSIESSLPELPRNCAYIPAYSSYIRVTLGSFSWEFKEVEQIFKASMTDVKIVKIDRMQNPVRWKNYQRKKKLHEKNGTWQ